MENKLWKELVENHLSGFDGLHFKNMFGGIGIFHDGKMFAKIGGGKLYLKVDEHNQGDFEAAGMKPYFSEKKKKGMPYWEVPAEVTKDPQTFVQWAQKSIEAAERAA